MHTHKYETDQYNSVYEWSSNHHAWIFIGKLNGQSLKEFIDEYENELHFAFWWDLVHTSYG